MFATILLEVGAQTCPFDGFDKLTASRLRVPSWVEGLRPLPRARPAFAKPSARQARWRPYVWLRPRRGVKHPGWV